MEQELVKQLTLEEYKALQETESWYKAEAGKLKKAFGLVKKPVDYLYNKVPESIREKVAEAILKVLNSVHEGSSSVVSVDKVYTRLEKYTGPLGNSPEFFKLKLRDLDRATEEIVKSGKNKCTAEGAATGVAGLPGIVVDVPALYGLLFHTIQEIAIAYGYEVTTEFETSYIFKVLEVGHGSSREERMKGMEELARLDGKAESETTRQVESMAIKHGLQSLARRLARTLITRKVSQSVVLVGGVIGAGVNRQLAGEVGATAQHAYRRRFLHDLARARQEGRAEAPASVSREPKPTGPPAPKVRLPKPPSYD